MASELENDISDKLYVIVSTAKAVSYKNGVLLAEAVTKLKDDAFAYIRNNKTQYCEIETVREYIAYARELKILLDELKPPTEMTARSKKGFKPWLGDVLLKYFEDNNLDLDTKVKKATLDLIDSKKLPTTENLYTQLAPSITEKHFKWSLTCIQSVRPLTISVCRKWIWVPNNTYEF